MIIYNDEFIKHFADNITDVVYSAKEADFVKYFEGHIEKLKEEFLKTRPLEHWNLLLESRELRRFRLHNFRPILYIMCKFKLLEHVTYMRNTHMLCDFQYRVDDGRPLCTAKGCDQEPMALISKVTKDKGTLVIVMLCPGHEASIHSNEKRIDIILEKRIKQYIKEEPEEALKYFPEYIETTVYDC